MIKLLYKYNTLLDGENIMKTDLAAVKKTAILFLHLEPVPIGDFGNLFVSHPYLNTSAAFLMETKQMFNIFEEPDKYKQWKKEIENQINLLKDLHSIFLRITNPYKLAFFKYVNEYLSEKDFAETLIECYTITEFTSDNTNVSKSEMLQFFKKAKKEYLMDEYELETYKSLPEQVEIYRGVRDPKYKYEFSWTLDYDKADWFANRFDTGTPIVYSCLINKSDILAYIASRGEEEVIVNAKNLKKYDINEEI